MVGPVQNFQPASPSARLANGEAGWKAGILGRPEAGRVFPQDGTRFLDELPYMDRSSYYWAEKVPTTWIFRRLSGGSPKLRL